MRFAIEDSDSEVSELEDALSSGYSSDDSFTGFEWNQAVPHSSLGRDLRTAASFTDEEVLDSEEEVEFLGLAEPAKTINKHRTPAPWNVFSPLKQNQIGKPKVSHPSWKYIPLPHPTIVSQQAKAQISLEDVLKEKPDEYYEWIKRSEETAWRDSQTRIAWHSDQLHKITSAARQKVASAQEVKLNDEAEEMRKLMEGMVIKHEKEEKELRQKFKERERALWKDIDDVIESLEKRKAAEEARIQAEIQKKKAEEDAQIAAAEKQAQVQKVEAERRAKEQAMKQTQAKLAREAEERRLEEEKQTQDTERRKVEKKGEAGVLWRKCTERQKWMKTEVTEPIKADKPTITALNRGKRLMTRWLGQTLNTKESTVKITNDVHHILVQQLPSPPSPSSPVILDDTTPKPYVYLVSHLSKVLIKQAESEITSKAASAFPLAKVVDQPREEYEKSTGRALDESMFDYISRMSSICTLYFAILQTPLVPLLPTTGMPLPTPQQLEILFPPFMRLSYAWTWLALALRDPMPASQAIATLVATWIEIALPQVVSVYGIGQTNKLREVIEREGIQAEKIKGDGGMARDKLGFLLTNWEKGIIDISGRDWAS
ncbi:uncharacterized protein L203_104569 [Cryptococcus depauperatus CBS 7841]|uniref:mRNA export factor GLE1 n=1 Tax=Cryptococcus depauperatus CBS 7841 TaxID=1295531 RepID=A0AAJ8JVP5_9TREE